MRLLSFLGLAARAGHTPPHADPARAPVSVKATEREPLVEEPASLPSRTVLDLGGYSLDRPLDPDLSGCDVAHVRAHLPNAERPSANLVACRHAAVLDQEAAFLADTSGHVPPPEREALIDALRFAAERLRDGVVIA